MGRQRFLDLYMKTIVTANTRPTSPVAMRDLRPAYIAWLRIVTHGVITQGLP